MAGRRTVGRAVVACLLLLAAGCASHAVGAAPPLGPAPAGSDRLALQIRHVGGFLPVGLTYGSLPVLSVYADGRVIEQGAVPALHPGPALPNLQVRRVSAADVRALVQRALGAGVGDTTDLGRPGVSDAATTRFTVVTDSATFVRDVYALAEGAGGTAGSGGGYGSPPTLAEQGVTPQQQTARARLLDLVGALTDLDGTLGAGAVGPAQPYVPQAVAAVVTPASPGPQDPPRQERPWPGPELPGTPLGEPGVTCVTATGPAAASVLDAARTADTLTPWTSAGAAWWVTFRPLLPGESGCADLDG